MSPAFNPLDRNKPVAGAPAFCDRLNEEDIYVFGTPWADHNVPDWGSGKFPSLARLDDPLTMCTGFPHGAEGGVIRPSDGRFLYIHPDWSVRAYTPSLAVDPVVATPHCGPTLMKVTSIAFDRVSGKMMYRCEYREPHLLELRTFYDGRRVPSLTGKLFPVGEPFDGRVLSKDITPGAAAKLGVVDLATEERIPVTGVPTNTILSDVVTTSEGWLYLPFEFAGSTAVYEIGPQGQSAKLYDYAKVEPSEVTGIRRVRPDGNEIILRDQVVGCDAGECEQSVVRRGRKKVVLLFSARTWIVTAKGRPFVRPTLLRGATLVYGGHSFN